jgi:hypothetical protein
MGSKGQGPLEKPQEMPHYMFCPRQKNNFQDFQNQGYIGIFMSQREIDRWREKEREPEQEPEQEREQEREREQEQEREQEREREREREEMESERERDRKRDRESERERDRKRDRESERERERESTKALAILFLNRLNQTEKSANYTALYGKSSIVQYVFNSP